MTSFLSIFFSSCKGLSVAVEQQYLDIIANETEKKKSLLKVKQLEVEEHTEKCLPPPKPIKDPELERKQLEFEAECQREANEKKALLQAVIAESAASGNPLPPSLIKLMHHNNCKFSLIHL